MAIIMVVGSHVVAPWFPGTFGVTLFFFISGFIITRLLLEDNSEWLPAFYIRRFFRLYPALLFYVVATTFILYLQGEPILWDRVTAALLFYTNYVQQPATVDFLSDLAPAFPDTAYPQCSAGCSG